MKNNINKKIGATLLTAAVMTGSFIIPVVKAADVEGEVKPTVSYQAHVQDIGWQGFTNGIAGTTGKSLRMEAVKVKLENCENVSLSFDAHVQDIGWMRNLSQESIIGTEGRSLRLEAIMINSDGLLEQGYKLEYRVHVQDIGWTPWVEEGEVAGTEGRSLRIEAIEIRVADDTSLLEFTAESLNDSLDTYKSALSTVKAELTQKGYDRLVKQIEEAMKKIEESKSVSAMEKIYDEVIAAIEKAYPAMDDLMAKVTTDLEDAQKLANEVLDNYAKVAPTVEGLTDYDKETIKTLIENARKAVENAKTAEEARKAKDDFETLMKTDALYTKVVTEVGEVNKLVEAQEALIKDLNVYQKALEDMPTTEISNTMKKVISDKIDMYKEDTMNAKTANEVNGYTNTQGTKVKGIKDYFNEFIGNYQTLVEKVEDTLLNNAIASAKEKITPYLTYKNDEPVDPEDEESLGKVETLAKQTISAIEACKKPEQVNDIMDEVLDENGDISESLVALVKDIEDRIANNYADYIKAYNAAIAEIDEYVAYAEKLGLSKEDMASMNSLVSNTKGNLSVAQTDTNVDKYMNLFRDSMAQYSSKLAEYATEQVRADAIATLKAYENDKTADSSIVRKAEQLRKNIEAKNTKGEYVINTASAIKAELKKIDTVINTAKINKAVEDAINEFKMYLGKDIDGQNYDPEVVNAASAGIEGISNGTYNTVEDVNELFEKLMDDLERALAKYNQSTQQVLDKKIKYAQDIVDEYIDIADKAGISTTILNGLRGYRAEITAAKNVTTVNNTLETVKDYIKDTKIKTILDAINRLKAGAYIPGTPDYADVSITTPAIKEEVEKQVENIKKATDVDKALENAEKAILELAKKISDLEGNRNDAINILNGNTVFDLTDPTKPEDELNPSMLKLYNSFVKEINAVNTNIKDYDEKNNGKANFDKIIEDAKTAIAASKKGIISIAWTSTKPTLSYVEGQQFNVNGAKLTPTLLDGTTGTAVDLTVAMVSGFDNTKVGKQTITITYQGCTLEEEVTIEAKKINAIAITTGKAPTKTAYTLGTDTKWDLRDGELTVSYNDGTEKTVKMTDDEGNLAEGVTITEKFEEATTSTTKITINYGGKTVEHNITVAAAPSQGD